jgi:hypothetical protein
MAYAGIHDCMFHSAARVLDACGVDCTDGPLECKSMVHDCVRRAGDGVVAEIGEYVWSCLRWRTQCVTECDVICEEMERSMREAHHEVGKSISQVLSILQCNSSTVATLGSRRR